MAGRKGRRRTLGKFSENLPSEWTSIWFRAWRLRLWVVELGRRISGLCFGVHDFGWGGGGVWFRVWRSVFEFWALEVGVLGLELRG
jgi:hypothetical protein